MAVCVPGHKKSLGSQCKHPQLPVTSAHAAAECVFFAAAQLNELSADCDPMSQHHMQTVFAAVPATLSRAVAADLLGRLRTCGHLALTLSNTQQCSSLRTQLRGIKQQQQHDSSSNSMTAAVETAAVETAAVEAAGVLSSAARTSACQT